MIGASRFPRAAALALAALARCAGGPVVAAPRVMVEDFESGRARWKDAGSGWMTTEVELDLPVEFEVDRLGIR